MKKLFIFIISAAIIAISGCKKNDITPQPDKPFVITDHFVAGTNTQKTGSRYTSVYFIQFLENNKALFIASSASNLEGTYTLTDSTLLFEVTGGNARTAKFTLDKHKKITSAYYTGNGPVEYEATAELLPITATNELAGKTFKGEEFKMGEVSNRQGLIYNFNRAGTTTYGSGTDAAAMDNTATNYTLIGGSGFKSVNGSTTELGFISNKKLTVFRLSGLYYYGKYDQQ
ncbi:hypothetical protein LL912_04860 [Niabella sp. CC-SYL272]|uniref:hypothetical protein n=1 Tax=Niabella agricola TaxID=2891571 RepID=UPI001F2AE622|nr:hypothetical protein [Niabella agricola]MCF3108099.1 hypothetical protein [Niabella agricola]